MGLGLNMVIDEIDICEFFIFFVDFFIDSSLNSVGDVFGGNSLDHMSIASLVILLGDFFGV
jgi:acyl-CoA hydrolase